MLIDVMRDRCVNASAVATTAEATEAGSFDATSETDSYPYIGLPPAAHPPLLQRKILSILTQVISHLKNWMSFRRHVFGSCLLEQAESSMTEEFLYMSAITGITMPLDAEPRPFITMLGKHMTDAQHVKFAFVAQSTRDVSMT